MDFLKDLLQIQHELILHQVSDKILNDDFEKEQFMNKYKKRNYCSVKLCNCKMRSTDRVKLEHLFYRL